MKYDYHLNNSYFQAPLAFGGVQIVQIGRMFCKSDTVIQEHVHSDLFELTLVTGGKGLIATNSVATKVSKGDIYLSFPFDTHKIESDPHDPLKFDFCAFRLSDTALDEKFQHVRNTHADETKRVFQDERIQELIVDAILEINAHRLFSKELLASVFNQVLIYTLRAFENGLQEPSARHKTHREILCYSLMQYIDSHVFSMRALSELETMYDYSYGYLSSLFKAVTNQSLAEYYRKKRLHAAALLVLEKKLSITQISEKFEYSSPYAFSKAFKKEYGVSPKDYRKQT